MQTYLVLIRGINVGGKNKVPMAELRSCLGKMGFDDITTYIASGNVILKSARTAAEIKTAIQEALPNNFRLDSELVKVLVLTPEQLKTAVDKKPKGFGDSPGKYHCDVVFLIGISVDEALAVFNPRPGVDKVWPGRGVIYSQRLSSLRTKSRLNKIVGTMPYKSMTIRSWNTTVKLLELISQT